MWAVKSILLSLVLFMLSCGSSPSGKNQETTKQLSDSSKVMTFDMTDPPESNPIGTRSMGRAKSGERLEDYFAVRNTTEKPMVILEAKTNCGCVTLDYTREPIKAGEQKVIKYVYDSRGKTGMQFSQITIKTTAGEYKMIIDLLIE